MVSLGVTIYAFAELFFYDHTYAKYLNILLWALDLALTYFTLYTHMYDVTVMVYVVT